mgnify:CR=1 FL=1
MMRRSRSSCCTRARAESFVSVASKCVVPLVLLLQQFCIANALPNSLTFNNDTTPFAVATRFTQQALQHEALFFPCDKYGAALLQQAMWEANRIFHDQGYNTTDWLSDHLDK